jgi:hypothetical protein
VSLALVLAIVVLGAYHLLAPRGSIRQAIDIANTIQDGVQETMRRLGDAQRQLESAKDLIVGISALSDGIAQDRDALKAYIDNVDSIVSSIREGSLGPYFKWWPR